ncbi:PREDICTED: dynein beta chain, ciliary-like [Acropora digitifera]|uniref:dynein beta chain, ciliary-like n=1 Tax=Acropora digitifera TaxID=70779 RepID=UPI00077A3ED5|nr:PREDICTED: dynein beta chain, ciliary-like [Acropora digitifera]
MACIKINRVDAIRPSEESRRQPHPILCSFALEFPLQNNVSIRKSLLETNDPPDPQVVQDTLKVEEHAVVLALRDLFMPALDGSDAVMFATLLADLFPNVQVPLIFDNYKNNDTQSCRMQMNDQVSNLEEIPVLPKQFSQAEDGKEEALDDLQSAIKVATCKLGLQPGAAFQARVAQFAELVKAHKLVCVTGPSGSGKTECIKTLAAAHREMGHLVKTSIVCTEAVESEELLGYGDSEGSEWHDGVLTVLLRRQAQQLLLHDTDKNTTGKPLMKWLHLDGTVDPLQMELFGAIVQNTGTVVLANNERIQIPDALLIVWEQESFSFLFAGTVVLANNERIQIPDALLIVWELETLANLSPAVLSSVGMLCMNNADVNWPLLVDRWLASRPDREVDVLRELCDRYIGPTLKYLASKSSVPPISGAPLTQDKPSQLRHVVSVTEMSMVNTLLTLVEAIISNYQDLTPAEFENYFCYAAMWAFGGTLVEEHRPYFSQWWKEQWADYVMLPGDDEVWNYYVFPETHEFLSWRISHLVGLLSDGGKPVLLVGEAGCGKTSILRHRLSQHGGDIGEVLSLTVFCNKFTTSKSLWREMSSCLEWKHARTFVPKGNKKLTCLVDDLNLSRVNQFGAQTAQQLVRQHIDHGGVFDPDSYQWREIHDVTYLSAYNPHTPPTTARLDRRLLRHFAVFNVAFPSQSELHGIYTQQLEKHFIIHATQSQHIASDTSSQEAAEVHSQQQGTGDHDKAIRDLLSAISHVTVELQDHLRGMFLPTAQRCHYIFTMKDLTMVFRNLCLTLRPGCTPQELLLLWKHECDWVYGHRLIDSVDRERFQQAFLTAAKKRFADDEQLSIVTGATPFFTNLVDSDDAAGEVMGAGSSEGAEDDVHLSFRNITDIRKVKAVLEHGIDEYNKDFPRLRITLYNDVMETICRLVRVLQCPHECGHALVISQGSPGMSTSLAQLAAHLCGYSVFRINSSALSAADRYTMESFKADLVSAYTRAGVKVKIAFFSFFFSTTVRENLRIVLTVSNLGPRFQKCCRDFPALINTVSIILLPHWDKEALVAHAYHLLKDVDIFSAVQKENLAHLLASMHLSIKQQDSGEEESGSYGHITNTGFQVFVEKFISLVQKRHEALRKEHDQMAAALQTIERGTLLAEQLKTQMCHEKMVLEQKKEGNLQLLQQIGQSLLPYLPILASPSFIFCKREYSSLCFTCRYHRMMQSKVKPLHSKVSETSSAVEQAVGKLSSMESKLKDLEERLKSLATAYEEASIDKCRQHELTQTLDSQLSQAAYFEEVLSSGRQKWLELLESISAREEAVAGGVAIAAAFASYLGPYTFKFRREMLTEHWPQCLNERGVKLVVDNSTFYAGVPMVMVDQDDTKRTSPDTEEVPTQADEHATQGHATAQNGGSTDEAEGGHERPPSAGAEKQDFERNEKHDSTPLEDAKADSDHFTFLTDKDRVLSHANLSEYDSFVLAILKLLLGEYHIRRVLTKGIGPRKIENAVLARTSWQRVPLLMDPYEKGLELIRTVEEGENLLEIDLAESDPSAILKIEKAIIGGTTLVLYNLDRDVDSMLMPLIYHFTTSISDEPEKECKLVKFGSRRVMCHPEFRLYLVSRSSRPAFSTEVSSVTALVNLRLDEEALAEEIQLEAFQRVQPRLNIEARKCMMVMMELMKLFGNIDNKLINLVTSRQGTDIWEETEVIAELVNCRTEVTKRLTRTLVNFNKLRGLRELFLPLAKRAVMMFSLLRSLSSVQHEYRFSLEFFLFLFRSAVGQDVEPPSERLEYESDPEDNEDTEEGDKTESRTTIAIKVFASDKYEDKESRSSSRSKKTQKRISVTLPPEVVLPSAGLEYTRLSDEESLQLEASLSQSFYRHVSRSLDQRHRLLFTSLLSLCKMEKQEVEAREEISLLLSGTISSPVPVLSDFDPTLLQPSWIAQEAWELILAVSTLKGPMDSICTHIAANPVPWKDWFSSERPETQPLPVETEGAELSALHKLLMIRCLRFDRFEHAMWMFVKNEVGELIEKSLQPVDEVLSSIKHSTPIVVILPERSSVNTPFKVSPVENIKRLAETNKVQCQQISVCQNQEEAIEVALARAVRTDAWLVVENLHLASTVWLLHLYSRLSRLQLQAETSSTPSQWRIFLLCEPADHLPVGLLLFAHHLAWDVIHREGPACENLSCTDLDLKIAVTSTLECVPQTYWEQARDQSLAVRSTLFGLCVNHSVMLMRQQLGTRSSSGSYPLSIRDLLVSYEMVFAWASKQDGFEAPQIQALSDIIARGVYGGKITNPWDLRYVEIVTRHVIKETALQQHSSLTLGSTSVPVPPANVDPADYSKWFKEKTGTEDADLNSIQALGLDASVEREYNETRASEFICKLDKLYRDINTTAALTEDSFPGVKINMSRLRSSMDLCLEQLPTLLKIEVGGALPVTQLLPRVLSQLRALSVYSESGSSVGAEERMSETMGYVIQMECQWFNCLLCLVRHSLQALEQCVIGGSTAISPNLLPVVEALQQEIVPADWLHPDGRPSPHTLSSWLKDLNRRHRQFSEWVRRGIVPDPSSEPLVGRGQLTSVWLGGLANPGALMMSLRHEKAAMQGCAVDEVELRCSLPASHLSHKDSATESEQGLLVSGLYLEGASFDLDRVCLVEAK